MAKLPSWLYASDLKRLWDINDFELAEYVLHHGLPAYECNMEPVNIEEEIDYLRNQPNHEKGLQLTLPERIDNYLDSPCIFKKDEAIRFAKENNLPLLKGKEHLHQEPRRQEDNEKTECLTSKERRKLGQLRTEKKKWDNSIEAAIKATLFCKSQNHPVTRNELVDELSRQNLASVPNTTVDRIWKAIPEELRNLGGRPKKSS